EASAPQARRVPGGGRCIQPVKWAASVRAEVDAASRINLAISHVEGAAQAGPALHPIQFALRLLLDPRTGYSACPAKAYNLLQLKRRAFPVKCRASFQRLSLMKSERIVVCGGGWVEYLG